VSEVQPKTSTFFGLYREEQVASDQIDDLVEAWYESDDSDRRWLPQYLGITEDEYSVWLASHKSLPLLAATHRDGRPVTDGVTQHLADLPNTAPDTAGTAIYVLTYWLKKRAET
jgi:hypothetical protein